MVGCATLRMLSSMIHETVVVCVHAVCVYSVCVYVSVCSVCVCAHTCLQADLVTAPSLSQTFKNRLDRAWDTFKFELNSDLFHNAKPMHGKDDLNTASSVK